MVGQHIRLRYENYFNKATKQRYIEEAKIIEQTMTEILWSPVQTSRMENLACQQKIQRATMVYRSLHALAPNYLSSKFERREIAYNLRDSENKLNVPCITAHKLLQKHLQL